MRPGEELVISSPGTRDLFTPEEPARKGRRCFTTRLFLSLRALTKSMKKRLDTFLKHVHPPRVDLRHSA